MKWSHANADKRRAVTMLLQDEEWAQWSDREIARRCCVHNATVSRIREELASVALRQIERKVERNGKVYTQDTSNIGRTDGMKRSQRMRRPRTESG